MDETYWKEKLTPNQYKVLREKGTEPPFTSELVNNEEEGIYKCAGCGQNLFSNNEKYNSKCGWPSFFDILDQGKVELKKDLNHGMIRTEVVCSKCKGHLGHLFDDGPKDKTGKRYCINGCALNFEKNDIREN